MDWIEFGLNFSWTLFGMEFGINWIGFVFIEFVLNWILIRFRRDLDLKFIVGLE